MRVAALYDIHGNLPALEAVLAEIRRDAVDLIVAGGDVIVGPMSHEALACLGSLDVPVQFIKGNCEVAVLDERAGRDPGVPAQARDGIRWTAQQLTKDDEQVVAAWPKTLRVDVPGVGDVLFCHATPRHENECFTRLTPEATLLPIFTGLGASLVVCGHTHMQFDRRVGDVRVVNAGSVGMPFGEPGAYWMRIGPDVELRHTTYDLNAAADRVGATTYPNASDFAAKFIVQPPAEALMLDVFSRVELNRS
jgi:putative phosphoesterase